MSKRIVIAILFLAAVATSPASDATALDEQEQQPEKISFNNQIRPILSAKCIACHGPDEEDRQADLRLDTFEGATESEAVVPGDIESSSLIERVTTDDEDMRMPPSEHGDGLTKDQIRLLKQWIEEGGNYETHWAFVPPKSITPPKIRDNERAHNPIDAFALAQLHKHGLHRNPPAHPQALLRRLSLDLTGLPPSAHPEEAQKSFRQFLGQPSNNNYSTVVDQLLATEAYGEHWGSMWLDIARYADTVGYSGDEYRDIWPWRDWLIRSINENKSYEQMTTEMLAGDLLPNATTDQKLATAFHRNTLSNNEGGTNDEEFRVIAVKDRISTTVNAWMGLTIRCAECHSHKFDPISQKEYYEFFDFFNQTADADKNDDRPKLEVYPAGRKKIIDDLKSRVAKLEKERAKKGNPWTFHRPTVTDSREGTKFEVLDDDSILATGPNPAYEEYRFTFEPDAGQKISSLRIEVLPHKRNNGNTGRIFGGAFIISQFRLGQTVGDGEETLLEFSDAAADFSQVNRHIKSTIKPKIDGKHYKQGWAVNHQQEGYRVRREAILTLKKPIEIEANTKLKLYVLHDAEWAGLNVGCVRVSTTPVEAASEKYRKKTLDPLGRRINNLVKQIKGPVRVPVLEDLPEKWRRETFVMARGNFESKEEKVSAKFPEELHSMPDDTPRNRLGVAKWLFAENNPLTARVAVNRYWARLFGAGIVETEEDFGTQGTPPSHPDLLDWLAVDFRENGWDVKRLLKQITMSATYRQSSFVDAEALAKDPRNLLLSRGPRIRLTAEVVRDQALAVSGLLTQKLYGPPVYPPSPIKKIVNAFKGAMTWNESQGEDRYRRTIYTYVKRSQPHPLFETFDMATRDVCSMRRLRTNTPLQSFMTLNDIMFVEAARALADDMIASHPKDLEAQIGHGLETALFADANSNQIAILQQLYKSTREKFVKDLTAASKLVGEKNQPKPNETEKSEELIHRASLTVVANVILNLDSFLNN